MKTPSASDIFVSPNGEDAASGQRETPLRSLCAALERATPGTRVILLPGVYYLEKTLVLGGCNCER